MPIPAAITDAPACGDWSAILASGPSPRRSFGTIYDPPRNRMLVFGGYSEATGFLNDLWELSLSSLTWTQLGATGTPPSPRDVPNVIYDPVRDRLLLIGGNGESGYLNDVWALSLAGTPAWTPLAPSGIPPASRYFSTTVYDPVRDRALVFGGYVDTLVAETSDLYELALGGGTPAWSALSVAGAPAARYGHTAIYDPLRDRMIVFGGQTTSAAFNDTWTLDLAGTPQWTQQNPYGGPPLPRDAPAAVYDAARDRMIVFGGQSPYDYLQDTWALSLEHAPLAWVQLDPHGVLPQRRGFHGAVFDPAGDQLVVFGGYNGFAIPGPNLADASRLLFGGGNALDIAIDAPDGGTVTRDPARSCYAPGETVTLTAVPEPGHTFDHWSGDASGTDNPLGVIMDGHQTIVAHFTALPTYPLVVSVSPANSGTVSRYPNQSEYPSGTHVTLTATPSPGATFVGWSGDASGADNPLSIVVDGPKNVVATFAQAPPTCGDWSAILPGGPSPRRALGAILDPVRNRMLVFGGYSEAEGYLNDVWALSLSSLTWTSLAAAGTRPSPRDVPNVIYDPVRDRLLLIGGNSEGVFLSDVWALSLGDSPTWTQLAPSGTPPVGRYSPSAVYDPVRDRVLVFGGYVSPATQETNELWELALGGGTPAWSALGVAGPPTARYLPAAIYDPVRDRMIVFGGQTTTAAFNDTWTLDLAGTPHWTQQNPSGGLPLPRDAATAVYDASRDRMILFGGQSPYGYLQDTWALSLQLSPAAWVHLAPQGAVPLGRGFHGAVFDPAGDQLVVFGGYNGDAVPGPNLADASRLLLGGGNGLDVAVDTPGSGTVTKDPAQSCYPPGEKVTLTAAAEPGYAFDHWSGDASGTDNPLSVVVNGNLTIVAHFAVGPPTCGDWSRIVARGPSPRRSLGMIYDPPRNRMLVFGGYSEATGFLNDLWELSLSTLIWTPLGTIGPRPSPRDVPNLIYDPVRDRLLLIGGNGESGYLSDVWALSFADTPSWTPLAPSGTPPAGRYYSSTVYDPVRDRALVFGGYLSPASQETNQLWELTLGGGTPAWNALSVANPPPARYGHTAIYDPRRDRMIVFGGQTTSEAFNDTWTLDLAGTPQWTQESPFGEPPALRDAAAAVYDPAPARDRMLVFGGQSPTGYLQDLWALSLKHSPPTWVQLDPHGAVPQGRGFHGAAFDLDANQLVVFGGFNSGASPGPNLADASRLVFGNGNALDVAVDAPGAGTVSSDAPRCHPPGENVTLTAVAKPGYLFDHWSGDASGTTNPVSVVMDGDKTVVAHFSTDPTATLLAQFDAAGRDDGVELRWRFGDPARVATVAVERAAVASGPWSAAAIEARDENGVTVALDRAVEPGGDYFYRLLVTLRDGSSAVFGPISTRTGERITESAITRLAPNPSSGATQVQFAVARAGRVRLTAIDVAGRVVATLVDGVHRPGRYAVAWDGATRAGRIPAGIYYLRLSAPDRNVVRRLAVVR